MNDYISNTMMKKALLTLVAALSLTSLAEAQKPREVIYLKDGSILYGTVIEQIPGDTIRVKLRDGSILVYKTSQVARITKDAPSRISSVADFAGPRLAGYVEGGYTVGSKDAHRIEILTSIGIQASPYIYGGVGVGVNYYTTADIEEFTLPIYANVRGMLPLWGSVAPFLDMKVGYSVGLSSEIGSGFYFSTTAGVEVGRFSAGLGIAVQNLRQQVNYSSPVFTGTVSASATTAGPTFRIGYRF